MNRLNRESLIQSILEESDHDDAKPEESSAKMRPMLDKPITKLDDDTIKKPFKQSTPTHFYERTQSINCDNLSPMMA